MKKAECRIIYEAKRKRLDAFSLQDRSAAIVKLFDSYKIPKPSYLLSYSPITYRKEFDVSACEQVLVEKFPGLRITWPKIGNDSISMGAFEIGDKKMFLKNRFDILEPLGSEAVDPLQLDIIFVPLLAFDTEGFRVGYGKGYYDRFLKLCRPTALKVGFSFFEPVEPIEDINEFDVPLNLCISPTRIYEF